MIRKLVDKLNDQEVQKEGKEVSLKTLLSVCGDDENNAMDFYRANGVQWIKSSLLGSTCDDCPPAAIVSTSVNELSLKLLIVLCSHKRFVLDVIDTFVVDSDFSVESSGTSGHSTIVPNTFSKLSLVHDVLNRLVHPRNDPDVVYYAVMLTMNIVRYINSPSVEKLVPGSIASLVDHPKLLTVIAESFVSILRHIPMDLSTMYVFQLVMSGIIALCSEFPDYITSGNGSDSSGGAKTVGVTDARYETMEQRKRRFKVEELLSARSSTCAAAFIELTEFVSVLMDNMSDIFSDHNASVPINANSVSTTIKDKEKGKTTVKATPSPLENYSQSFIICASKVFLAYKKETELKKLLSKYLLIEDQVMGTGSGNNGGRMVVSASIIAQCRHKAILQLILLTSQPATLGSWSILDGRADKPEESSHVDSSTDGDVDKKQCPSSESSPEETGAGTKVDDTDGDVPGRSPIMHLMYLISVGSSPTGVSSLPNYYYNQYIATEVICLAASEPSCHTVLAPLISSSILTSLMYHSPFVATRAAAASTLTKLGLKASAIKDSSDEVSCYLNTISDILQLNAAATSSSESTVTTISARTTEKTGGKANAKGVVAEPKFVSFSAFDNTAVIGNSSSALSSSPSNSAQLASSSSSLERAIEMLAALVGKTSVKEEIVHGSYRVKACITYLIDLALKIADEHDPKHIGSGTGPTTSASNSVIFGIMHSLSLLTVTNKELHMQALAEKDMTYEQYEAMQKLQSTQLRQERAKAQNVEVEDLEEEADGIQDDPDTPELCKRRIVKIVECNGIKAVVRLLGVFLTSSSSSKMIRELACRILRQICVVEGVIRGSMIQQGGLNMCNQVAATSAALTATDKASDNLIRREAAHAVAKTLVTTNPISLKDNQRISSIHSLVVLCKDNDSNNLQQFEGLLALTNLLSVGQPEKDYFVHDHGIGAVNYLMFSDHQMVRRAATECMCNLAGEEALLKIMRSPDKVRLWIGFTAEYCTDGITPKSFEGANNPLKETFLTARAAAGTLAGCCHDIQVAIACVREDIMTMFTKILVDNSKNNFMQDGGQNIEIVHRLLVAIQSMSMSEYSPIVDPATGAPAVTADVDTDSPQMLKSREELHEEVITYLISSNILVAVNSCICNYADSKGGNALGPDLLGLVGEICEVLQYYASFYGKKNQQTVMAGIKRK